ncbi:MAG TPA: 50S ribosomal L9 C-terminal domain-containing protein, partial [Opitutaceae bacterium]|nr:50S ribosomal L9 C-terminal domain-containing protein [Opitutaceae bacterium]
VTVDKRKIHLPAPVKTLGKHEATVKLHADISVVLSFDVVSENPIVPTAEEVAAAAPKQEGKRERRDFKR